MSNKYEKYKGIYKGEVITKPFVILVEGGDISLSVIMFQNTDTGELRIFPESVVMEKGTENIIKSLSTQSK